MRRVIYLGGLAATARVITSAALIMISVFAAFLLTPDVEIKMFAVGLTVAVLVDGSPGSGEIINTLGADFVTGGTVKYLLASAGLGFLWCRRELTEALERERKTIQTRTQQLQATRNALSKQVGIAKGAGQSKPLPGVSPDSEEGRAQNRRIEIQLTNR